MLNSTSNSFYFNRQTLYHYILVISCMCFIIVSKIVSIFMGNGTWTKNFRNTISIEEGEQNFKKNQVFIIIFNNENIFSLIRLLFRGWLRIYQFKFNFLGNFHFIFSIHCMLHYTNILWYVFKYSENLHYTALFNYCLYWSCPSDEAFVGCNMSCVLFGIAS